MAYTVITNVEDISEDGRRYFTVGYIVAAGTSPDQADDEAVETVTIDVNEDDLAWKANLDRALRVSGWRLAGNVEAVDRLGTGSWIWAPVLRSALREDRRTVLNPYEGGYVVEVYNTEVFDIAGEELGESGVQLDEATLTWLDELGVTPENPSLWVNIVPVGAYAPNNRPMAERGVKPA